MHEYDASAYVAVCQKAPRLNARVRGLVDR